MIWAAGYYTVFDDEAFSCLRYTLPPGEMVSALWHGVEPDPPLYYLLQSGWIRIFGTGPLGLRSFSILLFLVGLVFIRLAGEAWFDARSGRLAMLLCAMHPAHLFFGFAGRWYAAMFCGVAILLWQTGQLMKLRTPTEIASSMLSSTSGGSHEVPIDQGRKAVAASLLWSVAAAAVCYTNYFGPVVVGLIWLAAVSKVGCKRQWLIAAIVAIVLCIPWLPPFWRQVTTFPQIGGSAWDYVSTMARTLVALSAGNLASPGAWWVWVPLGVFVVCVTAIFPRAGRLVWPLAFVAIGCILAGTISRTMIDKYVMTFSGVVWLVVAGCLGMSASHEPASRLHLPRRIAIVALCVAWAGCGVNLMTQRHWSSLRWLDPFPEAIADLRDSGASRLQPADMVLPHPSARYYFACDELTASKTRADPKAWRSIASTDASDPIDPRRPGTVASVLRRMATDPPSRLLVMETAGFASDPDAAELAAKLVAAYEVIDERSYLDDPDAELKNRLDPRYQHPAKRIVVRVWQRRGDKTW